MTLEQIFEELERPRLSAARRIALVRRLRSMAVDGSGLVAIPYFDDLGRFAEHLGVGKGRPENGPT